MSYSCQIGEHERCTRGTWVPVIRGEEPPTAPLCTCTCHCTDQPVPASPEVIELSPSVLRRAPLFQGREQYVEYLCRSCGRAVRFHNTFCPSCGVPLVWP